MTYQYTSHTIVFLRLCFDCLDAEDGCDFCRLHRHLGSAAGTASTDDDDYRGGGGGDGGAGDGSAGPNEFTRIVFFSHMPSNKLL